MKWKRSRRSLASAAPRAPEAKGRRVNDTIVSHNEENLSRNAAPLSYSLEPLVAVVVIQVALGAQARITNGLAYRYCLLVAEEAVASALDLLWVGLTLNLVFYRPSAVVSWFKKTSANLARTIARTERRRQRRHDEVGQLVIAASNTSPSEDDHLGYREGMRFLMGLNDADRALLLERGRGGDDIPLSDTERQRKKKLQDTLRALLG